MSVAMEERPRRHRITVEEYHRMAEVGLLAPDARVELIEGVIVDMPPIGSRHASALAQLARLMERAVGDAAIVRCQLPIRLGTRSELQPDLALCRSRGDFYRDQHPAAAETLLLIEVSDSSLRYDLDSKASIYAQYGIQELWVVDIEGSLLHEFKGPIDGGYSQVIQRSNPGEVSIALLPGITVDVSPVFR
jgi:Uma2 family endonuclease